MTLWHFITLMVAFVWLQSKVQCCFCGTYFPEAYIFHLNIHQSIADYQQIFLILLASEQPCPVSPPSILTSLIKARQTLKPTYSKLADIYHAPKAIPSPLLWSHLPCSPFSSPFFNLSWCSACAPILSQLSLLVLYWGINNSNQPVTDTLCFYSCCSWEHGAACKHKETLNFPISKLTLKILLCHDALKKLSMVKQLVCRDHCLLCQSISSYF